jgi:2-dehydro-3-deoxyphosphooctonate aldolase (KDO 8-P synthase)
MPAIAFAINDQLQVGDGQPLLLVAGPCVIETEDVCLRIARRLRDLCARLGLGYVFKASFDKANRTSLSAYRGPGLERGLEILRHVRDKAGVAVTTDIHDPAQAAAVAAVADVLQIPAFLCRQTDLLLAAGQTGKPVNIKKGQFLAPEAMAPAIAKVRSTGNKRILITERGSTFGYGNLIVDMRALAILRTLGVPVMFDATHSVQLPGGQGDASGGQREYAALLARAAVGAGVAALFLETHPDPERAQCDGPNSLPLSEMADVLRIGKAIDEVVRGGKKD